MFKIRFRRELIDTAERRIEREKSMIKNYKEQIKSLQREWDAQRGREDRDGAKWIAEMNFKMMQGAAA
jgi:hypothetical protein